ncbi:MAG: MFS transporter [Clostridia bacterium]|nr:MFS transporter [Clostridia bacterium]
MVFYGNDIELLTFPNKKDRDMFIWQAVFGTVVVNLMFATFFSGIFIYFKTPDGLMGYVPTLPSIAGIFLIFSGVITEKIRNIKRVVVFLNYLSKTLILSIVWIPLLINNEYTPYIMLFIAFWGFLANAVMSIIINNWFVEVIDEKIRGRYMSARSIFTLIISATIPVIAGRFLDISTDKYVAFCVIFTVGWIFSNLESFSMSKISNPVKEEKDYIKYKFKDLFSKPLGNKEFMKFIWLMVFFHIVWNLSMTFASVYQLKYMEISYTYINLISALGAILQIFVYPVAGKMIDKYGSKLVMRIAFFFFMVHGLLYFFMVKQNAYILFFLLNINAVFINPAWALSTFNERFKIIPKQGRTIYDGFFSTVLGIAVVLGPVIGNLLRNLFLKLQLKNMELPEFRFLFLLTFIVLFIMNVIMFLNARKRSRHDENYVKFQPLKLLKKKNTYIDDSVKVYKK